MRKPIFGIAAIAALMLAGCAKNEVNSVNVPNTDAIHLTTNTSRAAINYLDNMQGDPAGFKCYCTSNGDWYSDGANTLDGSIPHICGSTTTDIWDFAPQVKWPTNAGDYPLNFYAWYPFAPAGLMDNSSAPAVTFDFEVLESVDANDPDPTIISRAVVPTTQVDLLSGKSFTNAKPASANLSMTFNHILSKINFGIIADEGYTAYVQSVGVANVAKTGTYDVVSQGNWTGASISDFAYSYSYYNGALGAIAQEFAGQAGNAPSNAASVAVPFYANPSTNSNHLMLMPQDPTSNMWTLPGAPIDPDPSGAPKTKTYIYLFYRCETTSPSFSTPNPNFIGYADASQHPDYAGIDAAHAGYTGPLFVKVGYPYTGAWNKGYGYIYNIELPGTSGGYLIDENFYDENGDPTNLEVGPTPEDPGGHYPDVPQPILNNDEYIHLIPVVTGWDDTTVIPVLK